MTTLPADSLAGEVLAAAPRCAALPGPLLADLLAVKLPTAPAARACHLDALRGVLIVAADADDQRRTPGSGKCCAESSGSAPR